MLCCFTSENGNSYFIVQLIDQLIMQGKEELRISKPVNLKLKNSTREPRFTVQVKDL